VVKKVQRQKKKFISKKSFLSARGMTKIVMFLCIVGFLGPFLTVSCGSQTFVTLNGFDVMMGKSVWVLDKLQQTPTDPIIILALLCAIVTLIAAFLPTYPISKPIWGLASIGGILILGNYIMTASAKIASQAAGMVKYDIPATITAMPGGGVVFCTICFAASIVMLIRKLFFEEADLLVLTPDEREVYQAIKEEEKEQEPEKERLRQELELKLQPLEKLGKKAEEKVEEEVEEVEEKVKEEVEKVEEKIEKPKEEPQEPAKEPIIEPEKDIKPEIVEDEKKNAEVEPVGNDRPANDAASTIVGDVALNAIEEGKEVVGADDLGRPTEDEPPKKEEQEEIIESPAPREEPIAIEEVPEQKETVAAPIEEAAPPEPAQEEITIEAPKEDPVTEEDKASEAQAYEKPIEEVNEEITTEGDALKEEIIKDNEIIDNNVVEEKVPEEIPIPEEPKAVEEKAQEEEKVDKRVKRKTVIKLRDKSQDNSESTQPKGGEE